MSLLSAWSISLYSTFNLQIKQHNLIGPQYWEYTIGAKPNCMGCPGEYQFGAKSILITWVTKIFLSVYVFLGPKN